jgi:hypothetical protein
VGGAIGAFETFRPPILNPEVVGEEGESWKEKGFLSGGTGGAGPLPALNAFLSDAKDPFLLARNPAEDEIDVPGVISDDEEPLLNLPNFCRSSVIPGPTL